MELKAVIEARTSIRNFLPDPVPIDDIREMVHLAGCAPSVNNYQPWKFICVTRKSLVDEMADVVSGKIREIPSNDSKVAVNVKSQVEWYATFFRNAPVLVAVCMDFYETILELGVDMSHDEINQIRRYPDIQSAGAAIENLLLSAVDKGYGACWMSAPMIAREEIEKLLGIYPPMQLMAFVAIGKPAIEAKPREKKAVDDILQIID